MAISALGSLSAAHRAVQRATPLVVAYASSADGLLLSAAKRARAQRRSPSGTCFSSDFVHKFAKASFILCIFSKQEAVQVIVPLVAYQQPRSECWILLGTSEALADPALTAV